VLVYNTQAILHLSNLENQQGIAVAEKAIALAEQLEDTPRLPRLYETLGLCWLHLDQARGCDYLERSLAYARKLGQVIRTANTMANLASVYVEFYDFRRAEPLLNDGLVHTTTHELDSVKVYIQGWQAIMFVHQGRWNEAADLVNEILQRPDISPGRGPALIALGRLRTRRGDPEADTALDEALDLLIKMGYRQREGMIRAARAEAAWLAGDQHRTIAEARAVYDFVSEIKHPWSGGELAFWLWQAGDEISADTWLASPFAHHIAGDWRLAVREWQQLGCPYEQARSLADGDQAAQIAALAIFERLGAQPAIAEVRRKLRAAGAHHLPRSTTRENPYALTQRQLDILALLVDGLTNAEIAAHLQLSPKTVDHHVSAVLAKLDVHSREAAADLARQQSIIKS
jgi:DNA-binding CsgD family transcriptional regulator